MADRRQAVGRAGEDAAADHLQRSGCEIVERNARTREGEIDLIALDGPCLVFVEVKSRLASPAVPVAVAFESIDARKQLRIRRLARAWLAAGSVGRRWAEIRFDAIAVSVAPDGSPHAVEHIRAAF